MSILAGDVNVWLAAAPWDGAGNSTSEH